MTDHECTDVVDLLRRYCAAGSHRTAVSMSAMSPSDGSVCLTLTRAEWDVRARGVAAHLRPGTRVLVLLPGGVDFCVAFAGVLYAGACAVPTPPPVEGRAQFVDIARDAEVDAIVTHSAISPLARRMWQECAPSRQVCWLEVDSAEVHASAGWTPPEINPDAMALLQYSSGSTGAPKGVAVSHRVLARWLDVLGDRVDLPSGSSVVTWLPVHHVFGLNVLLMAVWLDGQATLLPPEDVTADPMLWLRSISDAEAPVLSGAPPFGYQLCLDLTTSDDRAELDLSGWEVAIIGSERIRPELIDGFVKAFAPQGFQASAFFTAYGTTEIMMGSGGRHPGGPLCLTVDAAALEQGRARPLTTESADRAVDLVTCGRPGTGIEMLIVDPETRTPCPEGRVGELWVRGPAVAEGYWRKPELTEQSFRAWMSGGQGPYLRTGDSAFFLHGELVICGRLSEVLIIRGRNLLPHDVEQSVRACDPALTDQPAAAFTVDSDSGEQLVVLAAVDRQTVSDPESLVERAYRAVITDHEVEPAAVCIVDPGEIPLTSTGKVQRAACRKAYLDGSLQPITTRAAGMSEAAVEASGSGEDLRQLLNAVPAELRSTVLQAAIRCRVAALANREVEEVPEDTSLIEVGLDSMRLIRLRAMLATDLGLPLPMHELSGATVRTLTEQAGAVDAMCGLGTPDPSVTPDPAHAQDPFPLTDLQHAYLVGRSGGYALSGVGTHFYGEFDSTGLDLQRLQTAWNRVVHRHGALRSVISSEGTQRVLSDSEIRDAAPAMSTVDLRSADEGEIDESLGKIRSELSHQCFDADSWPPFDIRITRLPGGVDRVHVSLDLLLMDLWSLHIISREWQELYAQPHKQLAEFELTFRDYVLGAAGTADPGSVEKSHQYWRDRLETLPPGPELPLLAPPSSLRKPPMFTRRRSRVDQPRWQRLADRARKAGLTTSAVLLACYAAVLGRWSSRSRFTLNLPTFNRSPVHPDVDSLVGDFTSVTLLEVDLVGAGSVVELAQRVQRQLWQDLQHSDFGGVQVLRELARTRGDDAAVFAPVVFASASGQAVDGGQDMPLSWLGEQVFGLSQTPQVLLDFQLFEDSHGLEFNWDAVEELFARGALEDMFGSYCRLLERLSEESDEPWHADLSTVLLPSGQFTVDIDPESVPEDLLCAGVVEQARVRRDELAVVGHDFRLSFGELVAAAGVVADRLRRRGVGAGDVVAVSLVKSAAQIVAALGVSLAGAAYLPVDPDLPVARQDLLLERAGCGVVISGTSGRSAWSGGVQCAQLDLREVLEAARDRGPVSVPSGVSADDVAYVIFTSGSTGEPKGVAVSHRSALNTCVDVCERFDVGPSDRVLGLSSLSFDLSVWDVFGVLGVGGCLVVPEPGASRDPGRWWQLVTECGVTVWNSVPALAQMFVDYAGGSAPDSCPLRLMLLSGDWIPVGLPDAVRSLVRGCQVVSLGGATEAAIWSIAYEIGEIDPAWESIPYGWPLRNQGVFVLNDRWEECPPDAVGELFIAGAGLAEGYWGDEAKTAERFVKHPVTGERLYRTGDLGRRDRDGLIWFLGREDFQVKVGGYRIELGEIETALTGHEGVQGAVVTAIGDRHHQRLAACVVPTESVTTAGKSTAEKQESAQQESADAHGIVPEMFSERDREHVIFDELERTEFKLARHGVRTDLNATAVSLNDDAGESPDRASHRRFAARQVTLPELASLLEPLRSHEGSVLPKYAYASAGNCYGVQTYLWVADGKVEGLAGGTYYHDPAAHRLIPIQRAERVKDLRDSVGFGVDRQALDTVAFLVFFVADMAAVRPLYGMGKGRDFCLLETGLMAQLLDDHADPNGVGLCQMNVLDPQAVLPDAFQLGGDHEVLHSVLGGALLRDGEEPATTPETEDGGFLASIRKHLETTLPSYMVPTHLLVTDRLPLNQTGKVDRGAVERMVEPSEHTADASPPADELESTIAGAFQQVLGLDSIGVHTRFFDMGADSAAIVRAYRLLKTKLDQDFPLVDIFEHATVRGLARALSQRSGDQQPDLLEHATRRAQAQREARRRQQGRRDDKDRREGQA
jgi:amino acid adenylation domain-containing protein